MQVRYTVRAIQKEGNFVEEYEDASYPQGTLETEAWYFRAAVADGASETSFAREWAHELAQGFGRSAGIDRDFERYLPRLQSRWRHQLARRPALPWYAQEKLQAGAFSSLVGLVVYDSVGRESTGSGKAWHALAVGDSVLFHYREDALLGSFPITRAKEFSLRPLLIGSHAASNGDVPSMLRRTSGYWQSGDRFLLVTDALAHWLLSSHEALHRGLECLDQCLRTSDCFHDFITSERRLGRMRNDDVTLASLQLSG